MAPVEEWPTYGHDYGNQRYVTSDSINTRSVGRLVPIYVVQTGISEGSFESTPIVADGVLYVSTPFDGVMAVNARTGETLWRRPAIAGRFRLCCGPANRGVAITRDLVLIGQLDGVLVALNRWTGRVEWARAVANNADGASITMAPLIRDNMVFIGVAGSEFGVRGSLAAYDAQNGAFRWRWYATDPAHWFGDSPRLKTDGGIATVDASSRLRRLFAESWKHGGGGIWTTPAFDTTTHSLFFTTGNPWPDETGLQRPGDNLFTDSIVALDASTGRLRWYFQQTPHDVDDLDAASPPVLLNAVNGVGANVRAVAEVGKNGTLYVLDRATGELLRRTENLATISGETETPRSWKGGATWSPASFDPTLGYLVVTCAQHLVHEVGSRTSRSRGSLRNSDWDAGYGIVSAVDVNTGRIVWQDRFNQGLVGGSTSTRGGVTFVGEGTGYLDALATRTGERLWRFQTGAGVNAPPVVFSLDGREYVAVASGGNQQFGTPRGDAVFVFGLR